MSEALLLQTILTFEKYISQNDIDPDALRSAQARGWLDGEGRPTEEGRRLCLALASQSDTRSAFRNILAA